MAAVPSLEEEDAKRPSRERERENLVGERTRLVNRMKGALARLGVRGFKPTVRNADGRLEAVRTPEGAPLPPNTLAELRRDMARRACASCARSSCRRVPRRSPPCLGCAAARPGAGWAARRPVNLW